MIAPQEAPAEDDWDDGESSVTEGNIDVTDIEFNATIVFDVMGVLHREHVNGRVGKVSFYMIMSDNGTTGERDIPYFNIYNIEDVDIVLTGPYEVVDRIRNPALKMAVQFVMRSQLKQMVNTMVTRAARSAIKNMIGKQKT